MVSSAIMAADTESVSHEDHADAEEEVSWAPLVVEYGYYSALKSGSIDGTDTLPHDHAIVRAMNSNCTTKCGSSY